MTKLLLLLALAGAEGPASPDIQQAIQVLMNGLHAIASQKQAQQAQAQQPQQDDAGGPEPYGTGRGEPIDNSGGRTIPLQG